MNNYIKTNRGIYLYTVGCMILSAFLYILARNSESFAQWYATTIYPVFPSIIGRLLSLFPFSVFELGIYIISALCVFLLIKGILLFFINRDALKQFRGRVLRGSLIFLSSFVLLFTLAAGVNYSREPFAKSYGMLVRESSKEELLALCRILIADLDELAPLVSRDQNGLLALNEESTRKEATAALYSLGESYSTLSGYKPEPKPIIYSEAMSYLGITGIYSPFTIEANYNRDVPSYVIPYTMCHELAHLNGYMREEEAGFIAYKACRNSSSDVLRYSGSLNALIYSLNALNQFADADEYAEIFRLIPEEARADLISSKQYWQNHTAQITDVAEAANEKYLMANMQAQGTNSYGLMVDLLLSEYANVINSEEIAIMGSSLE